MATATVTYQLGDPTATIHISNNGEEIGVGRYAATDADGDTVTASATTVLARHGWQVVDDWTSEPEFLPNAAWRAQVERVA